MTDMATRFEAPFTSRAAGALLALTGCALAVTLGLAVGAPTPITVVPAAVIVGGIVVAIAAIWPIAGYAVMAASMFLLIVVKIPGFRVNPMDLMLPPVLLAVFFGTVRQEATAGDRRETGGGHEIIRAARRRFTRSVLLYFGLAAVSILFMVIVGRGWAAGRSTFTLLRGAQGLLIFPLGLWLLRGQRRIDWTIGASLAATVLLLMVNAYALLFLGVERAGISWWVNNPEWPIADPNEAGAAMLVVVALLMARHRIRPQSRNILLGVGALLLLIMTSSRSGLLALMVFAVLAWRQVRWRWVFVTAVVVGTLVPLLSPEYAQRIANTLVMKKNSFEAYTSMVRFFAWRTALRVFLAHPIFGVGYLGLVSVSKAYNELRLVIGAENYILEIAADLGIVGLTLLGFLIARLVQLGPAVRRATPPGTLGHAMATLHAPLMAGLVVASFTGTTFIGISGLGQVALWCALMVRAGHEAASQAQSARPIQG